MKMKTGLALRAGMPFRAAILALLAVCVGAGAGAFETLPNSWPSRVVSLHVNPNFPTALAGDQARQVEVLRCAADTWHDQSRADWRFDYRGTTAVARVSERDGVNAIFWSNSDGGDALAATLFCCEEAAVSYDIIFFASSNSAPNRWRGTGEPGVGEFDLQGVATHELGHALGLDHTSVSQATMFASASGRALPMRTLHEDDRAGVTSVISTAGGVAVRTS